MQEGEGQQQPGRDQPEKRRHGQQRRDRQHEELGDQHHPAAREIVGDGPAEQREQHDRQRVVEAWTSATRSTELVSAVIIHAAPTPRIRPPKLEHEVGDPDVPERVALLQRQQYRWPVLRPCGCMPPSSAR